ncbi:hypothetical protein O1611_g7805 [Lasiodiplodia mahajangana]|uniref:Uncharacterized protein n=1 Tax=Lasiodiplodia mahajangana TaxID=1108764 RepID=A0ACC2JF29_9PEZI|nr:hypothetical protein O1611_g7805 [Lasiodiplodia mahajangana]
MPRIEVDAPREWLLLESIYPIFDRSLPAIEHFDNVPGASNRGRSAHVTESAEGQHEASVNLQYPKLTVLQQLLALPRPLDTTPINTIGQSIAFNEATTPSNILLEFEQQLRSKFKSSEYARAYKAIETFNLPIRRVFIDGVRGTIDRRTLPRLRDEDIVAIQEAKQLGSSFQKPPGEVLDIGIPCHSSSMIERPSPYQIAFDKTTLWPDDKLPLPGRLKSCATSTGISLRRLVEAGGVASHDGNICEFEREDRRFMELLLAYSLLYLHDTAWFRSYVGLNMDKITTFPFPDLDDPLERWGLHIPCFLPEDLTSSHDQFEQIYCFGILLMEMETVLRANSLPMHSKYPNWEGSSKIVLEVILAEWARKVGDGYLRVARVCLDFGENVKIMSRSLSEHSTRLGGADIQTLGSVASILKYIVLPLDSLIANDHGTAYRQFIRSDNRPK